MNSRSMKTALSLAVCTALPLFTAPPASAQQRTGSIDGTVRSATGQPLASAQVFIPDLGIGTLTGEAGTYVLQNVPPGRQTVRVQLLGFGSAESGVVVAEGATATLDFELSQTAISLDELVVTGTAVQVRKKEIGNSVDVVSAAELEDAPVTNPLNILQGRAPGVTVMTGTGMAGAGSTIKIRGTTSLSQDTKPIIYVDGIRIFNLPTGVGGDARASVSPLQDIAAGDIARIEVIKGAAATTLYGTEAAAGVVQIFTKKGRPGQAIWNARVTTGVSLQGDLTPFDDGNQLFTRCDGVMTGINTVDDDETPEFERGTIHKWTDPTCPSDGSWFRPGLQQQYDLSVRGGAEGVTYYVSGNFGNANGTTPTQDSKDGGFRANLSFAPTNKLDFAVNTGYTRRDTRWIEDGNNADGFLLNVGRGYRGYFRGGVGNDCANVPDDVTCMSNKYIFDSQQNTISDHFITGVTARLNPTKQWSNRFTVGWDFFKVHTKDIHPFGFFRSPTGYFDDDISRHTKLSLDYAGSYRNDFGDDLVSTFSVGGQLYRDHHRFTTIGVSEFAGPGEPTIETGAVLDGRGELRFSQTSAGFFAQEKLGWKDRLFVTGGFRVDGNSAFGEEFGLETYPKVSVSYVLSDYDFWPTDWFDTFKLRTAAGTSGKAPGPFDKFRTWSPVSANEGQPGFTPNDVGNPNIGPERTLELEGGFDASWLAGRLGLSATAYQATTTDALVPTTLPPSEGFLSSRTANIGELRNRGLEFQLSGGLIRSSNISWDVSVNGSLRESNVIDIGEEEEISADNSAAFRVGQPAPVYVGDKILNPDEVANPVIVGDSVYGPVFPTKMFGIHTTLTLWNSLTLQALAEYQGGHFLPNYTGYQNERRGVWFPCYDVQKLLAQAEQQMSTAVLDQAGITAEQRAQCSMGEVDAPDGSVLIPDYDSDFWISPADFIKLRSVSLTYDIPADWIRFTRSASVTLSGRNLFTSSDYSGTDPEVEDFSDRSGTTYTGGGFYGRRDYYTLPAPRTFLLSFRVSF